MGNLLGTLDAAWPQYAGYIQQPASSCQLPSPYISGISRVELPIMNTFQYFPHPLTKLSDFLSLGVETGGLQMYLEH
jgi:hypothetical protein